MADLVGPAELGQAEAAQTAEAPGCPSVRKQQLLLQQLMQQMQAQQIQLQQQMEQLKALQAELATRPASVRGVNGFSPVDSSSVENENDARLEPTRYPGPAPMSQSGCRASQIRVQVKSVGKSSGDIALTHPSSLPLAPPSARQQAVAQVIASSGATRVCDVATKQRESQDSDRVRTRGVTPGCSRMGAYSFCPRVPSRQVTCDNSAYGDASRIPAGAAPPPVWVSPLTSATVCSSTSWSRDIPVTAYVPSSFDVVSGRALVRDPQRPSPHSPRLRHMPEPDAVGPQPPQAHILISPPLHVHATASRLSARHSLRPMAPLPSRPACLSLSAPSGTDVPPSAPVTALRAANTSSVRPLFSAPCLDSQQGSSTVTNPLPCPVPASEASAAIGVPICGTSAAPPCAPSSAIGGGNNACVTASASDTVGLDSYPSGEKTAETPVLHLSAKPDCPSGNRLSKIRRPSSPTPLLSCDSCPTSSSSVFSSLGALGHLTESMPPIEDGSPDLLSQTTTSGSSGTTGSTAAPRRPPESSVIGGSSKDGDISNPLRESLESCVVDLCESSDRECNALLEELLGHSSAAVNKKKRRRASGRRRARQEDRERKKAGEETLRSSPTPASERAQQEVSAHSTLRKCAEADVLGLELDRAAGSPKPLATDPPDITDGKDKENPGPCSPSEPQSSGEEDADCFLTFIGSRPARGAAPRPKARASFGGPRSFSGNDRYYRVRGRKGRGRHSSSSSRHRPWQRGPVRGFHRCPKPPVPSGCRGKLTPPRPDTELRQRSLSPRLLPKAGRFPLEIRQPDNTAEMDGSPQHGSDDRPHVERDPSKCEEERTSVDAVKRPISVSLPSVSPPVGEPLAADPESLPVRGGAEHQDCWRKPESTADVADPYSTEKHSLSGSLVESGANLPLPKDRDSTKSSLRVLNSSSTAELKPTGSLQTDAPEDPSSAMSLKAEATHDDSGTPVFNGCGQDGEGLRDVEVVVDDEHSPTRKKKGSCNSSVCRKEEAEDKRQEEAKHSQTDEEKKESQIAEGTASDEATHGSSSAWSTVSEKDTSRVPAEETGSSPRHVSCHEARKEGTCPDLLETKKGSCFLENSRSGRSEERHEERRVRRDRAQEGGRRSHTPSLGDGGQRKQNSEGKGNAEESRTSGVKREVEATLDAEEKTTGQADGSAPVQEGVTENPASDATEGQKGIEPAQSGRGGGGNTELKKENDRERVTSPGRKSNTVENKDGKESRAQSSYVAIREEAPPDERVGNHGNVAEQKNGVTGRCENSEGKTSKTSEKKGRRKAGERKNDEGGVGHAGEAQMAAAEHEKSAEEKKGSEEKGQRDKGHEEEKERRKDERMKELAKESRTEHEEVREISRDSEKEGDGKRSEAEEQKKRQEGETGAEASRVEVLDQKSSGQAIKELETNVSDRLEQKKDEEKEKVIEEDGMTGRDHKGEEDDRDKTESQSGRKDTEREKAKRKATTSVEKEGNRKRCTEEKKRGEHGGDDCVASRIRQRASRRPDIDFTKFFFSSRPSSSSARRNSSSSSRAPAGEPISQSPHPKRSATRSVTCQPTNSSAHLVGTASPAAPDPTVSRAVSSPSHPPPGKKGESAHTSSKSNAGHTAVPRSADRSPSEVSAGSQVSSIETPEPKSLSLDGEKENARSLAQRDSSSVSTSPPRKNKKIEEAKSNTGEDRTEKGSHVGGGDGCCAGKRGAGSMEGRKDEGAARSVSEGANRDCQRKAAATQNVSNNRDTEAESRSNVMGDEPGDSAEMTRGEKESGAGRKTTEEDIPLSARPPEKTDELPLRDAVSSTGKCDGRKRGFIEEDDNGMKCHEIESERETKRQARQHNSGEKSTKDSESSWCGQESSDTSAIDHSRFLGKSQGAYCGREEQDEHGKMRKRKSSSSSAPCHQGDVDGEKKKTKHGGEEKESQGSWGGGVNAENTVEKGVDSSGEKALVDREKDKDTSNRPQKGLKENLELRQDLNEKTGVSIERNKEDSCKDTSVLGVGACRRDMMEEVEGEGHVTNAPPTSPKKLSGHRHTDDDTGVGPAHARNGEGLVGSRREVPSEVSRKGGERTLDVDHPPRDESIHQQCLGDKVAKRLRSGSAPSAVTEKTDERKKTEQKRPEREQHEGNGGRCDDEARMEEKEFEVFDSLKRRENVDDSKGTSGVSPTCKRTKEVERKTGIEGRTNGPGSTPKREEEDHIAASQEPEALLETTGSDGRAAIPTNKISGTDDLKLPPVSKEKGTAVEAKESGDEPEKTGKLNSSSTNSNGESHRVAVQAADSLSCEGNNEDQSRLSPLHEQRREGKRDITGRTDVLSDEEGKRQKKSHRSEGGRKDNAAADNSVSGKRNAVLPPKNTVESTGESGHRKERRQDAKCSPDTKKKASSRESDNDEGRDTKVLEPRKHEKTPENTGRLAPQQTKEGEEEEAKRCCSSLERIPVKQATANGTNKKGEGGTGEDLLTSTDERGERQRVSPGPSRAQGGSTGESLGHSANKSAVTQKKRSSPRLSSSTQMSAQTTARAAAPSADSDDDDEVVFIKCTSPLAEPGEGSSTVTSGPHPSPSSSSPSPALAKSGSRPSSSTSSCIGKCLRSPKLSCSKPPGRQPRCPERIEDLVASVGSSSSHTRPCSSKMSSDPPAASESQLCGVTSSTKASSTPIMPPPLHRGPRSPNSSQGTPSSSEGRKRQQEKEKEDLARGKTKSPGLSKRDDTVDESIKKTSPLARNRSDTKTPHLSQKISKPVRATTDKQGTPVSSKVGSSPSLKGGLGEQPEENNRRRGANDGAQPGGPPKGSHHRDPLGSTSTVAGGKRQPEVFVCPLHGVIKKKGGEGSLLGGQRIRVLGAQENMKKDGKMIHSEKVQQGGDSGEGSAGLAKCPFCLKILSLFRQFCFLHQGADGLLKPLAASSALPRFFSGKVTSPDPATPCDRRGGGDPLSSPPSENSGSSSRSPSVESHNGIAVSSVSQSSGSYFVHAPCSATSSSVRQQLECGAEVPTAFRAGVLHRRGSLLHVQWKFSHKQVDQEHLVDLNKGERGFMMSAAGVQLGCRASLPLINRGGDNRSWSGLTGRPASEDTKGGSSSDARESIRRFEPAPGSRLRCTTDSSVKTAQREGGARTLPCGLRGKQQLLEAGSDESFASVTAAQSDTENLKKPTNADPKGSQTDLGSPITGTAEARRAQRKEGKESGVCPNNSPMTFASPRKGTQIPAGELAAGWHATLRCLEGHTFERSYEELEAGKWCPYCSAAALLSCAAKRSAIRHDKQVEQQSRERQQQLIQEARKQLAATRGSIPPSGGDAGGGARRPGPPCMAGRRGTGASAARPVNTPLRSDQDSGVSANGNGPPGLDKTVEEWLRHQAQEDVRMFQAQQQGGPNADFFSSTTNMPVFYPPASTYAPPPTAASSAAAATAAAAAQAAAAMASSTREGAWMASSQSKVWRGVGPREGAAREPNGRHDSRNPSGGNFERNTQHHPNASGMNESQNSKGDKKGEKKDACAHNSGAPKRSSALPGGAREATKIGSEIGGKVLTEAQALAVRRVLACKQKSVWAILQMAPPSTTTRSGSAAIRTQARAAFRQLALLVHPDKNPHPRAAEAMHLVTGAFHQIAGQH
ncbi:hypothetical protein CSUI_007272 [Cystoisospora suis]|uniref:Uncharacterized protein n=1 Tax=Cystoisospora suis TaxID=483139 RepID=A0A2C6KRI7_9APIC|nr:hypothetical protein CSUI_007272 [Cystoisospora suis]